MLQELALVLQQLALVQMLPSAADGLQDGPTLQALAQRLSAEQIQLFYQCAIHGKNDLPLAPDEQAGVMMTMLRMLALRPLGVAEVGANQQVVLPEASAVVETAPVQSRSEPVPEQASQAVSVKEAVSEPVQASEMRPVSPENTSLDGLQAAIEPQTAATQYAAADVMPESYVADELPPYDEHDLPPWEMDAGEAYHEAAVAASVVTTVVEEGSLSETEADAKKPEVEEMAETVADVTALALNADNWPHIVQQIAPQLSAARMLAQHAAFASFNADSGELHLEITHEGKVIEDRHYLNKLSDTLSAYTGRPVHVTVQDWLGEMETPHAQSVRHEEERREQGLQILQQDEVAQQLTSLFDGTWLPESVHLKTPSQ